MKQIKIVVWDNIGNTLLGVQPWEDWDQTTQSEFLSEEPRAEELVQGFNRLFDGFEVKLVWLYDEEKSKLGFRTFIEKYPESRPMTSVHDLRDEVRDADILILHKERVPDEVIQGADRLKFIEHLGQDYRGVPVATATSLGIPVAATPLINYIAVAEHAWALMLNHFKQLPALRIHMINRGYKDRWGRFPGLALARDRTLGLLGFGEIARPMARMAQAFEMDVIYWDITRFTDLERDFGISFAEWDEIFAASDVLSVQLALNEQTRGIIGAREISLMKPTALFMNTARGKLVDQTALVEALLAGSIAGAALDVFEEEPLPLDDPLHEIHANHGDRLTLTPHCASQSPWTWVRDSQELWFNVLRFLNGEQPRHLVSNVAEQGFQ